MLTNIAGFNLSATVLIQVIIVKKPMLISGMLFSTLISIYFHSANQVPAGNFNVGKFRALIWKCIMSIPAKNPEEWFEKCVKLLVLFGIPAIAAANTVTLCLLGSRPGEEANLFFESVISQINAFPLE